MSETRDIVERAKMLSGMLVTGEKIPFGSDAELITELALEVTDLRQRNEHAASMLMACGIEQSRLRSLLQEAVEALEEVFLDQSECQNPLWAHKAGVLIARNKVK